MIITIGKGVQNEKISHRQNNSNETIKGLNDIQCKTQNYKNGKKI